MEAVRQVHRLIRLREALHLARLVEPARHGQRRIFRQRMDPLEYYSEEEFLSRYRLSKESFNTLLAEIRPRLPSSTDRRGLRIAPSLQLLVALRYLATGNFQLTIADTADMAIASVSRAIKCVVRAIAQVADHHIRFPTPAEEAKTMQEFSTIANMPGVIGCIDGTLIPIKGPGGEDAELYRGRKGFFAYNVMAVCDASLLVTNLVVNWPGSAHDSRVFNESRLCQTLDGGHYRGFLLGDSGYPCRPYLLTPYSNPSAPHEEKFNISHIRTRNSVERMFGILKRRFAVLASPLRTKLATRSDIIVAAVVLHNLAVRNNLPLDEGPDVRPAEHVQAPAHENVAGQARRAEIAARFFV